MIQDRLRGFCREFGVGQVIALTAAVLVAGFGLAWWRWDWLRSGGAESNGEALRNISLVLGALVALVLAVWRSRVAERQSEAARRQADTAQRSLTYERIQKGVEMIGSPVLAVRLGGIYALDHLAQEYPNEHHVQVMHVLCAFVRNPFHDHSASQPDVRDAVKAIGGRNRDRIRIEEASKYVPDLSYANLRNLEIINLNFSSGNFEGADLSGSDIEISNLSFANLDKAILHGATLYGTNLERASVNRADLSAVEGAVANFTNASLRRADLSHANMQGAEFRHAELEGADLTGTVFIEGGHEANGLTQKQIDLAKADENHPPIIEGLLDAETEQRLRWSPSPR